MIELYHHIYNNSIIYFEHFFYNYFFNHYFEHYVIFKLFLQFLHIHIRIN